MRPFTRHTNARISVERPLCQHTPSPHLHCKRRISAAPHALTLPEKSLMTRHHLVCLCVQAGRKLSKNHGKQGTVLRSNGGPSAHVLLRIVGVDARPETDRKLLTSSLAPFGQRPTPTICVWHRRSPRRPVNLWTLTGSFLMRYSRNLLNLWQLPGGCEALMLATLSGNHGIDASSAMALAFKRVSK